MGLHWFAKIYGVTTFGYGSNSLKKMGETSISFHPLSFGESFSFPSFT